MSTYQKGDKVVLRKDLVIGEYYGNIIWHAGNCEELGELDYVEILTVYSIGGYEVTAGWCVNNEMIEGLYEEPSVKTDNTSNEDDTKYLWMTDEFLYGWNSEKSVLILSKNNRTHQYLVSSDSYKEILKGNFPCDLMTESEAKNHLLFNSVKRVEVEKEELYYVRLNGSLIEDGYLNHNQSNGSYFMSDCDEEAWFKTKFTEEECDKIIGTSEILYKELVK